MKKLTLIFLISTVFIANKSFAELCDAPNINDVFYKNNLIFLAANHLGLELDTLNSINIQNFSSKPSKTDWIEPGPKVGGIDTSVRRRSCSRETNGDVIVKYFDDKQKCEANLEITLYEFWGDTKLFEFHVPKIENVICK